MAASCTGVLGKTWGDLAMGFSRRQFSFSGLAVLGTAFIPARDYLAAQTLPAPPTNGVVANPLYATDGEKIIAVINGERKIIRLICCDAPEAEAGENKTEIGFTESRKALNDAIAGRTLLLESDVEDTDDKDRIWRHVWLVNADGTNGGLLSSTRLGDNPGRRKERQICGRVCCSC